MLTFVVTSEAVTELEVLQESFCVRADFRQDFLRLVESRELKDEFTPDSIEPIGARPEVGRPPLLTPPGTGGSTPWAATASRRPVTEAARPTAVPMMREAVPLDLELALDFLDALLMMSTPTLSTRSIASFSSMSSCRSESENPGSATLEALLIDRRIRSSRGCEVDEKMLLLLLLVEAIIAGIEATGWGGLPEVRVDAGGCIVEDGGGSETNSVRTLDTEGRHVLKREKWRSICASTTTKWTLLHWKKRERERLLKMCEAIAIEKLGHGS